MCTRHIGQAGRRLQLWGGGMQLSDQEQGSQLPGCGHVGSLWALPRAGWGRRAPADMPTAIRCGGPDSPG